MNQPTDDDQVMQQLVRASGTGPDANAVAAAADGARGTPEVARLARDPEAVLLLRGLARERRRKKRVLWSGVGLAACVLVGVVIALFQGDPQTAPDPMATRLEAALVTLKERDAERFADFALAREEDLDATSGVLRGGAAWIAPRGKLLEPPRRLRWRRPDGIGRVAITLDGPGVSWKQSIEADELDAPQLGSGRFVVTLRVLDGLAGQTIRRAFVVVDESQREAYAEARAIWKAHAEADLHALLEAHYAFGSGYLEAALDAARRAYAMDGEARRLIEPLLRRLER
ncbi:MAG: hypothetical protein QNJ90_06900 [Planctomycetota bacterium]|nr:hypothetical protein [Planctomycetota bacterium]